MFLVYGYQVWYILTSIYDTNSNSAIKIEFPRKIWRKFLKWKKHYPLLRKSNTSKNKEFFGCLHFSSTTKKTSFRERHSAVNTERNATSITARFQTFKTPRKYRTDDFQGNSDSKYVTWYNRRRLRTKKITHVFFCFFLQILTLYSLYPKISKSANEYK